MRERSSRNFSGEKISVLFRRAALCGVSFALCVGGCDRKPEPQPKSPTPIPAQTPGPVMAWSHMPRSVSFDSLPNIACTDPRNTSSMSTCLPSKCPAGW